MSFVDPLEEPGLQWIPFFLHRSTFDSQPLLLSNAVNRSKAPDHIENGISPKTFCQPGLEQVNINCL